MDLPVQVGDFVEIILPDGIQTYPIALIEDDRIYVEVSPDEYTLLVRDQFGEYQVDQLSVPHQVNFMTNERPMLTGIELIDLAILQQLDDASLESACLADPSIDRFCQGTQLWQNKLVDKFGPRVLAFKPARMNVKEYYFNLIRIPPSVGGANLALLRNDSASLRFLEALGYVPDIYQGSLHEFFGMLFGQVVQPVRFNEDILNFIRNANIGPQLAGKFKVNSRPSPVDPNYYRVEADRSSIEPIEGTRINDLLYIAQPRINGQVNPLYGISDLSQIMPLWSSHAYHTSMKRPDNVKRVSASAEMRKYLGNVMRTAIDNDVQDIRLRAPELAELAEERGEQLKEAINDPTLEIDNPPFATPDRPTEIFNPNNFLYAYFTKLNRASVVERLNPGDIDALRDRTAQVYSHLPDIYPENATEKVITIFSRIGKLIGGYLSNLRQNN